MLVHYRQARAEIEVYVNKSNFNLLLFRQLFMHIIIAIFDYLIFFS